MTSYNDRIERCLNRTQKLVMRLKPMGEGVTRIKGLHEHDPVLEMPSPRAFPCVKVCCTNCFGPV